MEFQSFHFIVFFLTVLIVVRKIFKIDINAKKNFLLIASYYFYMCWDWRFGFLIFFITFVNYYCGFKIGKTNKKQHKIFWIRMSLVISLSTLAYFKYTNFFIDNVNSVFSGIGIRKNIESLNIILPVGISFYTFHSISYTLDVYHNRIKFINSFRDFCLFVSFFPHLVAGPILRASYFLPQLENNHVEENKKPIETGMALIIRGYIKKVAIADILGTHIVDVAFSNPSGLSPVFLLLALYAYSFQVYMDFSGYTDIARGVSRCLGYELQINFNRPYKAISVGDFWQRWHISMSSFFRDYLYFGLGGSKHGNVYVNLFITFVAIGIWHGAAWNLVLYGVCHGLMVSIERWQFQKRKNRGLPSKKYKGIRLAIQMLWIFNLISITRVLFRGGSLDTTMSYLQALTDFSSIEIPLDWLGGTTLLVAIILHFTPDKWAYAWKEYYSRQPSFIQAAFIVVCIYTLIALADDSAPFIYFQF